MSQANMCLSVTGDNPPQSGVYFTGSVYLYSDLLNMTCKIANVLKRYGVKKGDRVAIYMPVVPLLVASMMACARIGAVHRLA